jgi:hypothetical protein
MTFSRHQIASAFAAVICAFITIGISVPLQSLQPQASSPEAGTPDTQIIRE